MAFLDGMIIMISLMILSIVAGGIITILMKIRARNNPIEKIEEKAVK